MTRLARKRPLRAFSAGVSALALGFGLVLAMGVVRSEPRASAGTTGVSPEVFVTSNGSSDRLDSFSLAGLEGGGATSTTLASDTGIPFTAVAVDVTAHKAVIGVGPCGNCALFIPPGVATFDLATKSLSKVNTTQTPIGIVVDPTNPAIAYALETGTNANGGTTSEIDRINVSTSPPGRSVLVGDTTQVVPFPASLAISSDGRTLFVGGTTSDFPILGAISVANPAQRTTWSDQASPAGNYVDLATAPNGSALYAVGTGFSNAGAREGTIVALGLPLTGPAQKPLWLHNLTSGTASPIQISVPTCLTVSPDGGTLYVGGNDGPSTGSVVQTFDSAGNPGVNVSVPMGTDGNGGGGLRTLAESPDSRSVLVAGINSLRSSTTMIDALPTNNLSAGRMTTFAPARNTPFGPHGLAITPDQAPSASFTAAAANAGSTTTFNASSSNVVYGSIVSYHWDFGDGTATTTGAPSVGHVYAAGGNYLVTLTETDSAGTSVPPAPGTSGRFNVDGPGQTPYRNALASARTQQTVPINTPTGQPPPPPPPPPHHGGTTTTTKPGHKAATPTLTLKPTVGSPGTIVTVTGKGFRPNTPVTVSWSVSSGSFVFTTDAHGNLGPRTLFILTPDVLGPRFAVASSTPAAKAKFLVVPNTSEPGGDNAALLFRSNGP